MSIEELDKHEVVEPRNKHTTMSSKWDKIGRVKLIHCGAFILYKLNLLWSVFLELMYDKPFRCGNAF